MTDWTQLKPDELISKLMEACREGWPVPMEKCRDEIKRRLTPSGDVGELLDALLTLINAPIQDEVTQGGIRQGLQEVHTSIAAMQAENAEACKYRERLEWLLTHRDYDVFQGRDGKWYWVCYDHDEMTLPDSCKGGPFDTWDVTIDAAMEATDV